ncbi:MAG TPA: MATE family efflux transporter [Cyclobacteriaceae bacterium]|nr:MATE family efflux transporter [Cyclobacteriaceae bacterium]
MELRLTTSYRQIFNMAMPISLSLVVPQINFITNNIFLGGLGEKALASAGITGVYYLIFAVIGNGLNNGLQMLISRRAGQNRREEIGRLFFHGVWVALMIAGLGILVTFWIAPILLSASIHDPAIARQVLGFLHIRILGLPLLYLYVMRNALLVGTNQTRLLVYGTFAEAVTNIFFDYGLIYGHFGLPRIGFDGAAYASIIAEGVGLVTIFVVIHWKGLHKQFTLFKNVKFDFSIFKLILTQSSPLIAQYAMSIIIWEYFYILIEHHGARALAISNTMRNIFGVFGIFGWAFASTANTMVSNIIGQERSNEVVPLIKRIAFISFCFSAILCVLLNVFPEWFLSFYGQGAAFIEEGIPVVRVVSLALLMFSFGSVWLNAVIGTGNPTINLIIELTTLTIYSIYVYIVLEQLRMSITWGWASEWVYWSCMFVMAYLYIRSGRWKGKIV